MRLGGGGGAGSDLDAARHDRTMASAAEELELPALVAQLAAAPRGYCHIRFGCAMSVLDLGDL